MPRYGRFWVGGLKRQALNLSVSDRRRIWVYKHRQYRKIKCFLTIKPCTHVLVDLKYKYKLKKNPTQ